MRVFALILLLAGLAACRRCPDGYTKVMDDGRWHCRSNTLEFEINAEALEEERREIKAADQAEEMADERRAREERQRHEAYLRDVRGKVDRNASCTQQKQNGCTLEPVSESELDDLARELSKQAAREQAPRRSHNDAYIASIRAKIARNADCEQRQMKGCTVEPISDVEMRDLAVDVARIMRERAR